MKKTPYKAIILAVFCQILWGVVFPVIKKSYQLFSISDIGSTFLFASIRFMTAGLILLLVDSAKHGSFPVMRKKDAPSLFLLGTVQTGLTYGFQFAAMISAASINCSILNGTSFIFMMIFAAIMFRDDRINAKKVIGAAAGFSGILVCFLSKDAFQTFSLQGEGLMLLSIMLFAFGTSLSRKVTRDIRPAVASGYNLLIGGAELFVLALLLGGRLGNGGLFGWACLAFLAMASSVCLMLWTSLVSSYGVGRIAVFQCVNPLSGAIAAALLLGENVFQPRYIISLFLVVLGIVIVNTDSSRFRASH